jgi:Tfp pilus assembly protein PilF
MSRKFSAVNCISFTSRKMLKLSCLVAGTVIISLPSAHCQNQNLPQGAAGQQNHQAVGMYNLGLQAYQQGSLESAIIFFRRATDLDPNLADAQYNLGVLYQSQRRAKEAIPRFQEVLRVKPSDPDAHYQLGLALMEMGRAAEAKTHFASIAPNSTHFNDAQKRSQMCDAQLSGATIATPSYSPSAQPQLNMTSQPAISQPAIQPSMQQQPQQPQQNMSASYREAYPTQSSLAQSSLAQSSLSQSSLAQSSINQGVSQPVMPASNTQYSQPVVQSAPAQAPVPAKASNPTAVMANTSVRVIATGFSAPSGLTFDRSGNLYVANYETNSVDRISADGTRSQFSSGAHLKGPIGLVADETGNIYVANYESNTVARITPAGISTIIGTGFKRPYYLALDKEGNLFVSQQQDNSIVRITLPRTLVTR